MSPSGRDAPPGSWRLLAPALLCWAVAGVAATMPGAGLAMAVIGAGIGFCALFVRAACARARAPTSLGRTILGSALLGSVLLGCASTVLIAGRVAAMEHVREDPALAKPAAEGAGVALDYALAGFPRRSESAFGERFWVRAEALVPRGRASVLLWLRDEPDPGWAPGVRVRARGIPQRLEPGGAAYGIRIDEVDTLPARDPLAWIGPGIARLRAGLNTASAAVPGAELVPGLAVGDTSLVVEDLEAVMKESSLTHLTAVSGANCALVTGAIITVLGYTGVRRRGRTACAAIALAGFVLLVGPDASVQRAAVMATVLLASSFGGKRGAGLPALGLATLVLLWIDPWQALQPGFALSVAATGGILLLATPITKWCRRRLRIPAVLALPVAVALSAQLACGPLLLLLQPGLPAVGVLANVVAGPAAPLGTGLGLLALLLLPVGQVGELLGRSLVTLASLPARWIAETARLGAELPLARWNWPGGPVGALLLAGCEILLLLAWAYLHGFVSLPGGARAVPRGPWRRRRRRPRGVRAIAAALVSLALGVAVAVVLVVPAGERLATPTGWAVVACDVGQGDAILLRDPSAPDRAMLVDTGNEPDLLRTCLDRFGVRRIALLVLSHDDLDHVGALGTIVDRVDAALVSPTVVGEVTERRRVIRTLSGAGVPTSIAAAGDRSAGWARSRGDRGSSGLDWSVMAPSPGAVPGDSNAASLVLLVDAGPVRVLLLADTGADEQRALLRSGQDLRADVLKAAHHGSADQEPGLPAAAGARWALVSVGAENRYGHPTMEALESLEASGARVLRTDLAGSAAIVPGEDGALEAWVEHAAPASADSFRSIPRPSGMSAARSRLGEWQQRRPARRARSCSWGMARLARRPSF